MVQLINSLKKRSFPRGALKAARNIKHAMRDLALAPKHNIKRNKFPIFHTKFFPRSASVKQALSKHWLAVESDSSLHRIFPHSPTVASRRQRNLRSFLISSSISCVIAADYSTHLDLTSFVHQKFPTLPRQNNKCSNATCLACPLLAQYSHIRSTHTHRLFPIDTSLTTSLMYSNVALVENNMRIHVPPINV